LTSRVYFKLLENYGSVIKTSKGSNVLFGLDEDDSINKKSDPYPDYVYINMGENAGYYPLYGTQQLPVTGYTAHPAYSSGVNNYYHLPPEFYNPQGLDMDYSLFHYTDEKPMMDSAPYLYKNL
jgi:hypothetical protein